MRTYYDAVYFAWRHAAETLKIPFRNVRCDDPFCGQVFGKPILSLSLFLISAFIYQDKNH